MNIWEETVANLFLRQHDNNETYKTHQETFLRKVCSVMYVTT
jgi:hypothetical protein